MPPLPFGPYYFGSRAEDPREREARRTAPFIIIGYWSRKGIWRAIWTDRVDPLGKFEGTRAEVIAWARERCDNIRIAPGPDDNYQDPRRLRPDDE